MLTGPVYSFVTTVLLNPWIQNFNELWVSDKKKTNSWFLKLILNCRSRSLDERIKALRSGSYVVRLMQNVSVGDWFVPLVPRTVRSCWVNEMKHRLGSGFQDAIRLVSAHARAHAHSQLRRRTIYRTYATRLQQLALKCNETMLLRVAQFVQWC